MVRVPGMHQKACGRIGLDVPGIPSNSSRSGPHPLREPSHGHQEGEEGRQAGIRILECLHGIRPPAIRAGIDRPGGCRAKKEEKGKGKSRGSFHSGLNYTSLGRYIPKWAALRIPGAAALGVTGSANSPIIANVGFPAKAGLKACCPPAFAQPQSDFGRQRIQRAC